MIELPVTLPFEVPLTTGLAPDDLIGFWREKIDWIRRTGGILTVLTHPERNALGNPRVFETYARLLDDLMPRRAAASTPCAKRQMSWEICRLSERPKPYARWKNRQRSSPCCSIPTIRPVGS